MSYPNQPNFPTYGQYQNAPYPNPQNPNPQYQNQQYTIPQHPLPQYTHPQHPTAQYPNPQYPSPQYPNPPYPMAQNPVMGQMAPIQPSQSRFQSIEDFMREQEQLDAARAANMKARAAAALGTSSQRKMSKKPTLDTDVVANEARAVAEIGDTNWTGRLLEYRNAHPLATGKGMTYNEIEIPKNRFTCLVKILESEHSFGDYSITFTKKKDAKQFASKKAIDWLIETKHMPADGTVKFPRAPPPSGKQLNQIGPQASPPGVSKTTFAGQIPELCVRLGLNPPKYEIIRVSEGAPLYNGYATFQGDPRIEGKIGVVKDVFGQKNAKERIAEDIFTLLKALEEKRIQDGTLSGTEDVKKRKRPANSDEGEDIAGKAARIDATPQEGEQPEGVPVIEEPENLGEGQENPTGEVPVKEDSASTKPTTFLDLAAQAGLPKRPVNGAA